MGRGPGGPNHVTEAPLSYQTCKVTEMVTIPAIPYCLCPNGLWQERTLTQEHPTPEAPALPQGKPELRARARTSQTLSANSP